LKNKPPFPETGANLNEREMSTEKEFVEENLGTPRTPLGRQLIIPADTPIWEEAKDFTAKHHGPLIHISFGIGKDHCGSIYMDDLAYKAFITGEVVHCTPEETDAFEKTLV